METNDFPRLVLDANIMISAVLGRSFPFLIALYEAGVLLMAPVQQLAETRHKLLQRPGLDVAWVDGQMRELSGIILPLGPALLDKHESKARLRLSQRGQPDWPILAACFEAGAAAWSRDNGLVGTGVALWGTKVLMRAARYALD